MSFIHARAFAIYKLDRPAQIYSALRRKGRSRAAWGREEVTVGGSIIPLQPPPDFVKSSQPGRGYSPAYLAYASTTVSPPSHPLHPLHCDLQLLQISPFLFHLIYYPQIPRG